MALFHLTCYSVDPVDAAGVADVAGMVPDPAVPAGGDATGVGDLVVPTGG